MSVNFKAGKYYVGDLCYVINNEHWQEILNRTNFFGNFGDESFEFKGKICFISSTANGDGRFYDYEDREYSVDAGDIGVMPFDIIDDNFKGKGGQIIEFENDFIASCTDKGMFKIGDIRIDTDDFAEDDEDDEEDWNDNKDDGEESDIDENQKPKCKLIGINGNVFNIIGEVRRSLKDAGLKEQLEEFTNEVTKQEDYDAVLRFCMKYVDVC